jgi:hypothetical protein
MAERPYIYVIGATGTAVIDPTNRQLIVIAPGITPGNLESPCVDHKTIKLQSSPSYITLVSRLGSR